MESNGHGMSLRIVLVAEARNQHTWRFVIAPMTDHLQAAGVDSSTHIRINLTVDLTPERT